MVVYNSCFGGFSLSPTACEWLSERTGTPVEPYDYSTHSRRFDPLLVECVQTLGEKANGHCAKLRLADVKYRFLIEDYDGFETVIADSAELNWVYLHDSA